MISIYCPRKRRHNTDTPIEELRAMRQFDEFSNECGMRARGWGTDIRCLANVRKPLPPFFELSSLLVECTSSYDYQVGVFEELGTFLFIFRSNTALLQDIVFRFRPFT